MAKHLTLGNINAEHQIPVELNDDKRTFADMLLFYIKHYDDKTIPKRMKRMPLSVAKKLYNHGKLVPKVVFTKPLLKQFMNGPLEMASQKMMSPKDMEIINMMILASSELISATYDRKGFLKELRKLVQNHLMMGRNAPMASACYPDPTELFRIYNRFHKDQFPTGDRYLVMLDRTKTWHDDNVTLTAHAIYDRHGTGLAVALQEAIDNPFWQMDKATAEKVANQVHNRLVNEQLQVMGEEDVDTNVHIVKVDGKLKAQAEREPMHLD